MAVGRVAEQVARQILLVDGGGHAADAELPGGEHHRVSAAWPRSNMTDSGRPSARGSGVTRAIADGRAGEVAGVRPDRRERLRRCSRSRHTTNAQRCWFLELLARRPA